MTVQGELKRNWRFVAGAFVGIGGGFASLYFYTAGLFIKPLAAEFGWTRGEASLGAMAFTIGNVIGVPVAGRLVDRFGEVRVAFVSGMSLALSFVALGMFTQGLSSFLLLVLGLTLLSAGSNAVSYNRVIIRHFTTQRGLALGLALTGTAFGAALMPPHLGPFIATHGWRQAYFVLAVFAVTLTGAAALLLREKPAARSAEPAKEPLSWGEICGHPAFLSTSAMILLSSTAVLGTTLHLVPLLSDSGLGPADAGAVASSLGIAVILGRVLAGHFLDRWDAGWVAFILLNLAAGGALLLWTGNAMLMVPGAILIGFGVGTEGDLLAYLLGRRFPVRHFGSVYGTIFGVHALGGGIGGLLAGGLFDVTGNYALWLLIAAGFLAIAAMIALATERAFDATSIPDPLQV